MDIYRKIVAPKVETRNKKMDELFLMYSTQKERKHEEDTMRKSMQKTLFKSSVMASLAEQKNLKTKQILETKKQEQDLDRQQVEYDKAKDESWTKREDKNKADKIMHGQKLIKDSLEK